MEDESKLIEETTMRLSITIATVAAIIIGFSASGSFAKSPKGKFAIKKSSSYTVSKLSRRQFDQGSGINFKSDKPTIAGTGKFHCEAGFKFAAQNNGITKKELNEFAEDKGRQRQIKAILGGFFKVSNMKIVTLQGYKGHEMTVAPRRGPGHKNVRGMMVIIETPQGRMSQVCMTKKSEYRKALSSFRAVTKNIVMPE